MSEHALRVVAELIDDKVQFRAHAADKPPVLVDYVPPYGRGDGHTSLELLLISLATCFASTVKLMLVGHAKVPVEHVRAVASGTRRRTHPTALEAILLELEVTAPTLSRETLDSVVAEARSSICPVLAMLDRDLPVELVCRLRGAE